MSVEDWVGSLALRRLWCWAWMGLGGMLVVVVGGKERGYLWRVVSQARSLWGDQKGEVYVVRGLMPLDVMPVALFAMAVCLRSFPIVASFCRRRLVSRLPAWLGTVLDQVDGSKPHP